MKAFLFEINLSEVLSESAIWPDGNAPPNPTVKDVEALFCESPDVHATARKWGFEITKGDVQITEVPAPPFHGPFAERLGDVLRRGYNADMTSELAEDYAGWLVVRTVFQLAREDWLVSQKVTARMRQIRSTQEVDLLEFTVGLSSVKVVEADPDLVAQLLFAEAWRKLDVEDPNPGC